MLPCASRVSVCAVRCATPGSSTHPAESRSTWPRQMSRRPAPRWTSGSRSPSWWARSRSVPRGRWALLGELGLGGEVQAGSRPAADDRGTRPARGRASGRAGGRPRRSPAGSRDHRARRPRRSAEAAELVRRPGSRAWARSDDEGGAHPRGGGRRIRSRPRVMRTGRTSRTCGARRRRAGPWRSRRGEPRAALIGAPGAGKTLLARTIPGLLPPLDAAEAQAATVVASVAGDGPVRSLVTRRPFRAAPPHGVVRGAGGRWAAACSRRGDPGPQRGALRGRAAGVRSGRAREALRQPLEEGSVAIARVGGAVEMPARFKLVAAMNPCPCGWAGDPSGRCTCPIGLPDRYAARVSGPFRDRLDLWIGVPRVAPQALLAHEDGEASALVAARVAAVRTRQLEVRGRLAGRLSGRALRAACLLDTSAQRTAIQLADAAGLTARATERLLRVARTIADLDNAERVAVHHLEEAARYRVPASPYLAARVG